ncbi:hypothetical protein GGP65_001067 [Salinibacter ruber]|nr:hypothetical protein [Salinibacter ruber]
MMSSPSSPVPPLHNYDRLTRPEFDRRINPDNDTDGNPPLR